MTTKKSAKKAAKKSAKKGAKKSAHKKGHKPAKRGAKARRIAGLKRHHAWVKRFRMAHGGLKKCSLKRARAAWTAHIKAKKH